MSIASPEEGASVKGNLVALDLTVEGVDIVKADGDTSGKSGHFHAFIDREPVAAGEVIAKEPGIVHSTEDPLRLTGLGIGEHKIVVVLGDGAHRRIGDAQAERTVTVEGPTIDATAPATAKAGEAVSVEITADGVTIAPGTDAKAGAGHFHLFIDRDPTAAGQPIPVEDDIIHTAKSPVEVTDLAAGDHVIWVVLGDNDHVPWDPQVIDRVTVTVE